MGYNHLIERDKTYWASQDGKKRLISEMSNTHLDNSIAYMRRNSRETKRTGMIDILEAEQVYRHNNEIYVTDYNTKPRFLREPGFTLPTKL